MAQINNYLKFVTKVTEHGWKDVNGMNCRRCFHVGDNFIVEITLCEHDRKCKNDLANQWVKFGYIDRFLLTHIGVRTYYTDNKGNCSGAYNIQERHIPAPNGGAYPKIDFDYMLEATPENVDRLVAECIRMREMDIRK